MHCTNCNSELPDSVRFCPECGMRVVTCCPSCGCKDITSAMKFCPECGSQLLKAEKSHNFCQYTVKDFSELIERVMLASHYLYEPFKNAEFNTLFYGICNKDEEIVCDYIIDCIDKDKNYLENIKYAISESMYTLYEQQYKFYNHFVKNIPFVDCSNMCIKNTYIKDKYDAFTINNKDILRDGVVESLSIIENLYKLVDCLAQSNRLNSNCISFHSIFSGILSGVTGNLGPAFRSIVNDIKTQIIAYNTDINLSSVFQKLKISVTNYNKFFYDTYFKNYINSNEYTMVMYSEIAEKIATCFNTIMKCNKLSRYSLDTYLQKYTDIIKLLSANYIKISNALNEFLELDIAKNKELSDMVYEETTAVLKTLEWFKFDFDVQKNITIPHLTLEKYIDVYN